MRTIHIKTETGESSIYLGEKIENFSKYLPKDKKVVILTDQNILNHYSKYLQGFSIIEMGLGEKNKTLQTLEKIFEEMIRLEVDRSSFLVAIGGGIVCDVGGYVASTFMRGIKFGFVST